MIYGTIEAKSRAQRMVRVFVSRKITNIILVRIEKKQVKKSHNNSFRTFYRYIIILMLIRRARICNEISNGYIPV